MEHARTVFDLLVALCPYSVGLFYYTLGNLSPKYRSSLHSIQLLIAIKSNLLIKYGVDKVLQPVLEEIKQLEMVTFIEWH